MNMQVKSSLIILTTLFIGIIIGALGMNLFKNQRDINFERFRGRQAFMHLHEGILQPTNEAQRDTIHKILSQNLPKFREISLKHREEISALIDSIQKQLEPFLTKEQIERFNERRKFLGNRKGPGPRDPMNGVMPPPLMREQRARKGPRSRE